MAEMEIGMVRMVDIDEEMQQAYLSYSMSVIVARALPDVRDGLKPVQRRILYACYDMGLHPSSPYKKSARIVGEVLGKYHPHGDVAVYEAMARLAQDFSVRYLLIDGQGNFGSVDGDAPAAMRYTEARLAPISEELLADIRKETVDFGPNFDDSLQEPLVLPAALPALLVNGASGIAVGMATNIPPHNLGEVVDALAYVIDHWGKLEHVSLEDLMKFIKGPDFPTGGIVFRYDERVEGGDAIRTAYATGRGRLTVQAKAHIEEIGRGKANIIVTELPYQVNKSNLIERIASLVREGRLEGITDVRDESDRTGMRLIIETTRTVEPKDILAELYRLTPLRSTFGLILLALVDGEPRMLSLKKVLQLYVEHRQEIVTRRTRYDLARAEERAHILEGLIKALASIDEVIQTIRNSPDADTARARLMKRFKLSEIQATAILDMPLRRLARLERTKLQAEYKELQEKIKLLQGLLKYPKRILGVIKDELLALKENYADARRTHIAEHEQGELMTLHELTPEAQVWVSVSVDGVVTRLGESLKALEAADAPAVALAALMQASTRDTLYIFSDTGRVGQTPVHQVSDSGSHAADLTGLARDARLVAALALPRAEDLPGYVLLGTRAGVVKRVAAADLVKATGSAFSAINIEAGDSLEWVRLTPGEGEIVLVTMNGQAIRFPEESVRPMGLNAGGVMGVKLAERDAVVGLDVARPGAEVLIVTENGYGKRTLLTEYALQGRYGVGVVTARPNSTSGKLAGAVVVLADASLVVVTNAGRSRLIKAQLAPRRARDARMAAYVPLERGDAVAALLAPAALQTTGQAEPTQPETMPEPAKKKAKTKTETRETTPEPTEERAKTKAAPKTAAPKTAAPKTAAPKTAAPKTAAPKTAAPKTAAPKTAAPKAETKKKATPKKAAETEKKKASPPPTAGKPATPETPPSKPPARTQRRKAAKPSD